MILLSEYSNDIKIKSGTIEFIKESNKINFLNNVEIDSDFVKIIAESAIYDDVNSVTVSYTHLTLPTNREV